MKTKIKNDKVRVMTELPRQLRIKVRTMAGINDRSVNEEIRRALESYYGLTPKEDGSGYAEMEGVRHAQ